MSPKVLQKYLASKVPFKGKMYRIVDTFRNKGSLLEKKTK